MIHPTQSPLAGRTVRISSGRLAGNDILVEDWWDRIAGKSWMDCDGNPACIDYAMASLDDPLDDEVVYGKVGSFGKLVHVASLKAAA